MFHIFVEQNACCVDTKTESVSIDARAKISTRKLNRPEQTNERTNERA